MKRPGVCSEKVKHKVEFYLYNAFFVEGVIFFLTNKTNGIILNEIGNHSHIEV